MLDETRPLGEQLRHAAAEARGHGERVLQAAEGLPYWEQIQLRDTADKLTAFSNELLEIADELGDRGTSPVTDPCPPELLIRIEGALDRYEAALAELGGIADELSEEAEDESSEPIH